MIRRLLHRSKGIGYAFETSMHRSIPNSPRANPRTIRQKPTGFLFKPIIVAFACGAGLAAFGAATTNVQSADANGGAESAKAVLFREYPALKGHLELSVRPIKGSSGDESYRFSCRDNVLHVVGSTPVAACRGAYEYLRNYAHGLFTWDTKTNPLVLPLPKAPETSGSTPFAYRHYFNVCTFGYSTVWWDWARWQKEIDWMALHGINMPLAMNGQERVWEDVFKNEYHMPQSSLDKYFSGPAFLPWFRMGNEFGYMGPLTQHWMDGQAHLQKKILDSERALGMKPVVPGFSGFVPVDFAKYNPGSSVTKSSGWVGFAPTTFLDVRDPLFPKIGADFIRAYEKRYGKAHYFLCDTFNEMTPPFPKATHLADLANAAKSIYGGIRAAQPDGVWVMQGWLFLNEADYWKEPEVNALLDQVPKGKMVVLDLADDQRQIWKLHPAFRNTDWIYCTLHNFGQNTSMGAPLQADLTTAKEARAAKDHGRMVGMGLTMEGILQNPVLYELMCDEMWSPEPGNLDNWLAGYVKSRYGSLPPAAMEAWKILLKTVYSEDGGFRGGWRLRPGIGQITARQPETREFLQALKLLLSVKGKLAHSDGYQKDLVDLTKTWLGEILDQKLGETESAVKAGSPSAAQSVADCDALFNDIDQLLATRKEYRLSTWVDDARRLGNSASERDWLQQNAKLQVTVWGGQYLYDYANKEWAGLVISFERARWDLYFADLAKGEKPDYLKFEQQWAMNLQPVPESNPEPSLAVIERLVKEFGTAPAEATTASH